jgi:hypothetical protein
MALWGWGLGAGLGVAYGVVAAPLGMLVTGILYARMGLLSVSPLVGVPAGMLFAVPFGIIVGLILGVAAGTLLGILNGLLLAALAYFFFLKTDNAVAYRRAARVGGAMVSVAVLVAAWAALGFETNAFVGGGPAGTIDGGIADVVILEIGPMLVAAWATQFASMRVANLCLANAPGGDD